MSFVPDPLPFPPFPDPEVPLVGVDEPLLVCVCVTVTTGVESPPGEDAAVSSGALLVAVAVAVTVTFVADVVPEASELVVLSAFPLEVVVVVVEFADDEPPFTR